MVVAFYFRLHLAYFPRPVVAIFARPEHHHVVVFLNEVCDVLAGGLAQPFPFFADSLVEGDGNLSTQVFGSCHSRMPPSLFVTQAYPKDYEKAITNTIKEWHTNEAEAT